MMTQQKVHFIFPSEHIAGCEKRMLVFWIRSKQEKKDIDLKLSVKKRLYLKILNTEEIAAVGDFENDVSFLDDFGWDGSSKFSYIKAVSKYVRQNNSQDIFHFFMYPPLFSPFKKVRTIFTFPGNSFNLIKGRLGKLFLFAGFKQANAIDILDPEIYEGLKKKSRYRDKVFLTKGGSFINVDEYPELSSADKKNSILFLSRWDWQKQVIPYVRSIPAINAILKKLEIPAIRFYVIGFGEDEERIREIIKEPSFENVDIEVCYTPNPRPYLLESRIILSLQVNTNYPSKGLLEGLAAGCLPVVTDVGSTRMIADPSFSSYVPVNFKPEEIAATVASILSSNEGDLDRKMKLSRQFAREHFKYENMASYYLDLYNKVTCVE